MFRTGVSVTGITADANNVFVFTPESKLKFDYAIVAMSTRAMQVIGLDRDTPGGPFNVTSQDHTKDSLAAVQSIQAAIHQLNMVSANKMIATVPEYHLNWPKDPDGQPVTCFVTDRYPSVTSVMPGVGLGVRTLAVVTGLGNDALKFQTQQEYQQKDNIARAFGPQDDTHIWPQAVVGEVLRDAEEFTVMDWNRRPGVGGGFKLDRPGDSYLSGSLFYHCQLANEDEIRPYSRVFLAGDSVGFMGGWAEGSAMSALNATTAVLTQIAKEAKTNWVVRSAPLIDPKNALFHKWRLMGTATDALPRLKATTRVVDCSKDPTMPGTWRYDGGTGCTLVQVAVSQDGRQMFGANADGTVYHRRFRVPEEGWSVLTPPPNQLQGVRDIAISTTMSSDQPKDGVAHVLVAAENAELLHRLRQPDGSWTDWGVVPDGHGGAIYARRCAIATAIQGKDIDDRAQVCVITRDDRHLQHLVRYSNGTWSDASDVAGPGGGPMTVNEVAVASAYTQDYTLVAVVDLNFRVQLIQRNHNGGWGPWNRIELPDRSLSALRISLVGSPAPGRGQLLVQCSDGNLYRRLVDLNRPDDPRLWSRVPYPQGAPYQISDIALGRSVANECDPAQSVAVWTVGDL
jgi:hypothetical protein